MPMKIVKLIEAQIENLKDQLSAYAKRICHIKWIAVN